jgi:uncharacterized protein (DUF2236 family)
VGGCWQIRQVGIGRQTYQHLTLVLRTYGHLIPGQDQEAADRLAQMLRDLQCTRSAQAAIAGLDRYAAAGSQGPPFSNTNLAERVGFEPTIGLPL